MAWKWIWMRPAVNLTDSRASRCAFQCRQRYERRSVRFDTLWWCENFSGAARAPLLKILIITYGKHFLSIWHYTHLLIFFGKMLSTCECVCVCAATTERNAHGAGQKRRRQKKKSNPFIFIAINFHSYVRCIYERRRRRPVEFSSNHMQRTYATDEASALAGCVYVFRANTMSINGRRPLTRLLYHVHATASSVQQWSTMEMRSGSEREEMASHLELGSRVCVCLCVHSQNRMEFKWHFTISTHLEMHYARDNVRQSLHVLFCFEPGVNSMLWCMCDVHVFSRVHMKAKLIFCTHFADVMKKRSTLYLCFMMVYGTQHTHTTITTTKTHNDESTKRTPKLYVFRIHSRKMNEIKLNERIS